MGEGLSALLGPAIRKHVADQIVCLVDKRGHDGHVDGSRSRVEDGHAIRGGSKATHVEGHATVAGALAIEGLDGRLKLGRGDESLLVGLQGDGVGLLAVVDSHGIVAAGGRVGGRHLGDKQLDAVGRERAEIDGRRVADGQFHVFGCLGVAMLRIAPVLIAIGSARGERQGESEYQYALFHCSVFFRLWVGSISGRPSPPTSL